MRHRRTLLEAAVGLAVVALATVAWGATTPRAQDAKTSGDAKPALHLRAFAVDLNRPGVATDRTLDIVIEHWSTDAQRDALRDTLVTKGSDALLSAIQKIRPRVGYVRTSTSLGWDLQFARERLLPDGGRRVIVASDRPIGFWEALNQPRSIQYEFLAAEIRLDKDGRGEGKLFPAADVTYDKAKRTIEVENYETYPIRLMSVQVVE
jgi:hypothetical protein